jgi:hypothetical protein
MVGKVTSEESNTASNHKRSISVIRWSFVIRKVDKRQFPKVEERGWYKSIYSRSPVNGSGKRKGWDT